MFSVFLSVTEAIVANLTVNDTFFEVTKQLASMYHYKIDYYISIGYCLSYK